MAPPRQRERERPSAQHQQQTPTDTNHSYAEEGQVRSPRMGPSRRRANHVAHEHGVGQTESALRRSQAAEVDEEGDGNGNANGVEIKPEEPMSWLTMPLRVLHDYRFAYNLPCPSAFASPMAPVVLSQGIGLRSPTALAARRAEREAEWQVRKEMRRRRRRWRRETEEANKNQREAMQGLDGRVTVPAILGVDDGLGNSYEASRASSGSGYGSGFVDADRGADDYASIMPPPPPPTSTMTTRAWQPRVPRARLAGAVRRHFGDVGLVEQDAVARFLYKVRQEGRGREFRLRFRP